MGSRPVLRGCCTGFLGPHRQAEKLAARFGLFEPSVQPELLPVHVNAAGVVGVRVGGLAVVLEQAAAVSVVVLRHGLSLFAKSSNAVECFPCHSHAATPSACGHSERK